MGKMFGPGQYKQGLLASVFGPKPIPWPLQFQFNTGLSDAFTFTRASSAWGFNSAGVLTEFTTDTPVEDYDPASLDWQGLALWPSSSNQIRNPRAEGASAPSTFPTNWSAQFTNGLSVSVVGSGSESGIPYLDARVSGTTTGNATCNLLVETSTGIAALTGQTWTYSPYLRLVAGSFGSPSGGPRLQINEATSSGGFITGSFGPTLPLTNAALRTQRYQFTRTLSGGATVACVQPLFTVTYAAGATVDFTIRIGLPQMEQQPYTSSPIMPPVGSPAVSTRAADNLTLALPYAGFPGAAGWTAVLEFSPTTLTLPANSQVLALCNASGFSNEEYATISSVDTLVHGTKRIADVAVLTGTSAATLSVEVVSKLGLAVDGASLSLGLDGAVPVMAVNAGYPIMTTLAIGRFAHDAANYQPMHARSLRLWPYKLSDGALQAVTA